MKNLLLIYVIFLSISLTHASGEAWEQYGTNPFDIKLDIP